MPTAAKSDPAVDSLTELFKSIGLSQVKAQETAKSKNAAILKDIIEKHPSVSSGSLDEKQAGLLVTLAGALNKSDVGVDEREYVITRIIGGQLKSVDQVTGESPFISGMHRCLMHTVISCRELRRLPQVTHR
jgi:glutaminyl-tRNA synthetase